MIWSLIAHCRANVEAGGVSIGRQLFGMALLYVLKGVGPGYYLQARFWRTTVRIGEQFAHYNEPRYRRQINKLNSPKYQKISQHKVVEKAVLLLQGLPTPSYLGFYHPVRGYDMDGLSLRSASDLLGFLAKHIGERICFKAVEGFGGSTFSALDVVESEGHLSLRHPIGGEQISVDTWAARLGDLSGGWILEAYLTQHSALSALNPDSVNTLRLIVLQTSNGFETRCGMLRVGRTRSQVDNTSAGGFACPIDISEGCIIEALDLTPMRNSYSVHPDTGAELIGFRIPHWEKCLETAGRALAAFPNISFAGVDIAVMESGPSVIELNVYPDRRFAAHVDLPHAWLFAEAVRG